MNRIVITDNSEFWKYIFGDIKNVVAFPYNGFKKGKNIGWFFYRLAHSEKFGCPLLKQWNEMVTSKWCDEIQKGDIVLFINDVIRSPIFEPSILSYLKERGAVICILLLDSIDRMNSINVCTNIYREKILKTIPLFDQVYSFDIGEAIKYNWKYTYQYYSYVPYNMSSTLNVDVFCVMWRGDRLEKLVAIYDFLSKNGIKCLFFMNGVSQEEVINFKRDGIVFNKYLSYNEILDYIMQTKVLLEIVKDGQRGVTLRAFEAIVYNKRLLTNSKAIEELPFYNKGYMKIYSSITDMESIDCSFFTSDEEVDYHYNGEFSPIKLFEQIEESMS